MKKHFRIIGVIVCSSCLLVSCKDGAVSMMPIDESALTSYGWRSETATDLSIYGNDNIDINLTRNYATLYFLGDGIGMVKSFTHYDDTSWGSMNKTTPIGFIYDFSDNTITITFDNGQENSFSYVGDHLLSIDGGIWRQESISSSDRQWINENKYYILPDDERLNVSYFACCALNKSFTPYRKGNVTEYCVDVAIGFEADQHARERGITEITADFSITGGTFSKKPKLGASPVIGKDCEDYEMVVVTTSSKAFITMSVKIYDSKGKRYYSNTLNYSIP